MDIVPDTRWLAAEGQRIFSIATEIFATKGEAHTMLFLYSQAGCAVEPLQFANTQEKEWTKQAVAERICQTKAYAGFLLTEAWMAKYSQEAVAGRDMRTLPRPSESQNRTETLVLFGNSAHGTVTLLREIIRDEGGKCSLGPLEVVTNGATDNFFRDAFWTDPTKPQSSQVH